MPKKPLPVATVLLTQQQIEALLATDDPNDMLVDKALKDGYAALERALARLENRTGNNLCPCGGRTYTDTARALRHNLTERHQEWLRFMGQTPTLRKDT